MKQRFDLLQNNPFHAANWSSCARETSKEEAPDCGCSLYPTPSSGFEIAGFIAVCT